MKQYTVTADVNSEKFGKGQLVAQLNEAEFIEYANLSDNDKLQFLKNKGAEFRADINELEDKEVENYKIQSTSPVNHQVTNQDNRQVSRKMRVNINGQDTGWVDVTEENEAQYNDLMNQFNQMHQQFHERFNRIFSHRPASLLDFDRPIFRPLLTDQENKQED